VRVEVAEGCLVITPVRQSSPRRWCSRNCCSCSFHTGAHWFAPAFVADYRSASVPVNGSLKNASLHRSMAALFLHSPPAHARKLQDP
jgi:hypothetical protein